MLMMMLLGSTWSPPPQLVAVWSGDGGVEVTLPPDYEADCTARFQLSDGVTRVAWEETLLNHATLALDFAPPAHSYAAGAKLLLNFQATCTSERGQILERIRLPGLLVQLDGDRVTRVDVHRPEGEGTMILDGALGTWTASAEPPAYDPDDDPNLDSENEEVAR